MPTVELDAQEWGQVMAMLATQPWRDANPLLMKIGNQLRPQQLMPLQRAEEASSAELRGNGPVGGSP